MRKCPDAYAFVISIFSLFLILISGGCSSSANSELSGENNELKYAKCLKIWQQDSCYYAQIISPDDSTQVVYTYKFPASGTDDTKNGDDNVIVVKPDDKRLMLYTTVHASGLDELNAIDKVKTVVDADYFTQPEIKKGLQAGTIADAGNSASPSLEILLSSAPDYAVVSMYDGMNVNMLERAEIPIIYMAENLEPTPLGRAEWIKFLGLICGKKEAADSIFADVEKEYLSLKETASKVSHRPKVMLDNMYQGIWYMAGGNSCQAQMISDAGGDYAMSDTKESGGVPFSLEQIIEKCSDADLWLLHLYDIEPTYSSISQENERYALFAPYKKRNIWYSNTAKCTIFDDTSFHPERILSDYITIFHPELVNAKPTNYFKRVAQ